MPVEYTKKAPQATIVNTTSVREVKDEPIDRPGAVAVVGTFEDLDIDNPTPSLVFAALLTGDVANRGIGWYANAGPAQGKRVELLKKTEQEILAHYAKKESQ